MKPETIAIISAAIAFLSAGFAAWTIYEARKGNNLSRLTSLLEFRKHYLELMENEHKKAEFLPKQSSGMQSVHNTYAELDSKLRDVNNQIDLYHNQVIENKL